MSDLEKLSVNQLKQLIRDYKKDSCPPYSKLDKSELEALVSKLGLNITLIPKKPKKTEPKLKGKAKELNEIYNEVNNLIEKNKNILEKIPFGKTTNRRDKPFKNFYDFYRNRLGIDVVDSSSQGIDQSIKSGKKLKEMILDKIKDFKKKEENEDILKNLVKDTKNKKIQEDYIKEYIENKEKYYGVETFALIKEYLKQYLKVIKIRKNKEIPSMSPNDRPSPEEKKLLKTFDNIAKLKNKHLTDNNFSKREYRKQLTRDIRGLLRPIKVSDQTGILDTENNREIIDIYKKVFDIDLKKREPEKKEPEPNN